MAATNTKRKLTEVATADLEAEHEELSHRLVGGDEAVVGDLEALEAEIVRRRADQHVAELRAASARAHDERLGAEQRATANAEAHAKAVAAFDAVAAELPAMAAEGARLVEALGAWLDGLPSYSGRIGHAAAAVLPAQNPNGAVLLARNPTAGVRDMVKVQLFREHMLTGNHGLGSVETVMVGALELLSARIHDAPVRVSIPEMPAAEVRARLEQEWGRPTAEAHHDHDRSWEPSAGVREAPPSGEWATPPAPVREPRLVPFYTDGVA